MFYVYILQSEKDNKYYIGYTVNLSARIIWHNEGKNKSTKHRRPLKLIYIEEYKNKKDAMKREKEIKSYKGGNAFKKLLNKGGIA
ncbi:MAG: GIY-YIG nuclease family protein [Patescibacteria group bacterium]